MIVFQSGLVYSQIAASGNLVKSSFFVAAAVVSGAHLVTVMTGSGPHPRENLALF